jgi:spore germination protein GerM
VNPHAVGSPVSGRPVSGRPISGRLVSRRTALLIPLLTILSGCAVGAQTEPERVDVPTDGSRPAPDGTAAVRIYLVRNGRLLPVIRRARPIPENALALLAAGPTPAEASTGLRSALPARPTAVRAVRAEAAMVVVEVDEDLALLPGRDAVLAAAQLVWTATEALGIDLVRLHLDGRPLAVPTDSGPTVEPLRRGDVDSVAPR